MTKTKTTPCGGRYLTVLEAWLQQHSPVAPRLTVSNSLRMPQVKKLRTAKTGRITIKKPHKGKVQAEGGAEAPPEETPPAPEPSNPKPGTSKDPSNAPAEVPIQNPTQTAPQNPDEETPPNLTDYVKNYQQVGKVWLATVLDQEEQVYTTLFDTLQVLGDPHIDNFTDVDRQQVFKCIRDMTGRFLREDNFLMYVEKEEEQNKPKYKLTGDTREA